MAEAEKLLDAQANLVVEAQAERPATGVWAVMQRSSQAIDALTGALGKISQALVLAIFLVGIINVILRYVGRGMEKQLTSNRWIEGQWYLFALITLFGLAYGVKEGINPRVDFWYASFSAKRKAVVDLCFHGFLIAFAIVGLRELWPFFQRSWDTRETSPDPDGLSRYPLKAMLVVAFVTFLLAVISEVFKNILVLASRSGRVDRSTPYRVE